MVLSRPDAPPEDAFSPIHKGSPVMLRFRLRLVMASASAFILLLAVLVTARGQQSPAANFDPQFLVG